MTMFTRMVSLALVALGAVGCAGGSSPLGMVGPSPTGALVASGEGSGRSSVRLITERLMSPRGLDVNVSGSAAIVRWNAVQPATVYGLQLEALVGPEYHVPLPMSTPTVTGTTWMSNSLTDGRYRVRVRVQQDVYGDWSGWVEFTVGSAPAVQPPAVIPPIIVPPPGGKFDGPGCAYCHRVG